MNSARFWLFVCAVCMVSAAVKAEVAVTGFAYKDGAIDTPWIYREDYIPLPDQGVKVVYSDAAGNAIATKVLDYSQGLTTPSFEFHDNRFDRRKSAEVMENVIVLSVASDGESDSGKIERESKQVVDAGFTHFIREHWQTLLEGERVSFYFALPNRLTNVKLQASMTPCEQGALQNFCFELALRNRFLALFVDTLTLEFDADKRLIKYQGRSNLSSSQGGDQDVTIIYQHTDPELRL